MTTAQGNLIGMNPTGTITAHNGTLKPNGNNNIVMDTQSASKKSLEDVHSNKVICNSIEKFENYNNNNLLIIFLLLLFTIAFIFLFFRMHKK